MNDKNVSSFPERSAKDENRLTGILLGSGLAMLLIAGAFFSGLHMGTAGSTTPYMEANLFSFFRNSPTVPEDVDLEEFWRVWELMEEKFVVSTTSQTLTNEDKVRGAINGLVKSYDDPYTVYLPPQEAGMFEEDISGNFGGVGMEVGIRDGLVTIISPLPDTPAEAAGLLSGDAVVKIDGESTESMNIDEAVRLIRGEIGTTVTLTIYRKGETDFMEIPVVRDNISIPTIDTKEKDDVFVISLYSFNALSEKKMEEAFREYVSSGKDKLVLDLRGNPGGYLQSAVGIASYFLPAGKVVVSEGFGGDQKDQLYRSSGKTLKGFDPKEMVILVNGGSASASEILAGALSEHHVATLMGDTTFGKGSVQELVDLKGGSSLKVTVARWFTPEGKSISDGGLDPDVFVERTVEQIVAGEDPQLEAAIKWLNGDKTVGTTTKSTTVFED